MVAKKSVKEQIEEYTMRDPVNEHGFNKILTWAIIHSSYESSPKWCLARGYQRCGGLNDLITPIHTHPDNEDNISALPSMQDLENTTYEGHNFYVIAQTNNQTGEVEGYTCLRRTRKMKSFWCTLKGIFNGYTKDLENYNSKLTELCKLFKENPTQIDFLEPFKEITKKLHLQYRFVPMPGYTLSDNGMHYIKLQGGQK